MAKEELILFDVATQKTWRTPLGFFPWDRSFPTALAADGSWVAIRMDPNEPGIAVFTGPGRRAIVKGFVAYGKLSQPWSDTALAVVSSGQFGVIDMTTTARQLEFAHPEWMPISFALHPNRVSAVSGRDPRESKPMSVWDLKKQRPVGTIREEFAEHPVFTPDGRHMAYISLTNDGYRVVIQEWATGKQRRIALNERGNAMSLAVSSDGRQLAVGLSKMGRPGEEAGALIIDIAQQKVLRRVVEPGSFVSGLDYSPDGKRLAMASWDGRVRLYDARTGRLLHTMTATASQVQTVAFAPNSRLVASSDAAGTCMMWDVATGKLLWQARDGSGNWSRLHFLNGGQRIVTSGQWLVVRDANRGDEKARLYLVEHNKQREWLWLTPDGYWTSSPGARTLAGSDPSRFMRPDKVREKLKP